MAVAAKPIEAHMARRPASGSALLQARALWRDAVAQTHPDDRFRIAHLAALRATAALLSTRPPRARRYAHRPTSAWVLVLAAAPEFSAWAEYFAAGVPKRAAADAGVVGVVEDAEAVEMIEAVRVYLSLVHAELIDADADANADSGPGDNVLAFATSLIPAPPAPRGLVGARAS